MVTQQDNGMVRVTVTLRPEDVSLIDRLAAVQRTSRSAELRGIIDSCRPIIESVVGAFEAALGTQAQMDEAIKAATERDIAAVAPEIERIQRTFLGVMSRLEGAAAAADAEAAK